MSAIGDAVLLEEQRSLENENMVSENFADISCKSSPDKAQFQMEEDPKQTALRVKN